MPKIHWEDNLTVFVWFEGTFCTCVSLYNLVTSVTQIMWCCSLNIACCHTGIRVFAGLPYCLVWCNFRITVVKYRFIKVLSNWVSCVWLGLEYIYTGQCLAWHTLTRLTPLRNNETERQTLTVQPYLDLNVNCSAQTDGTNYSQLAYRETSRSLSRE